MVENGFGKTIYTLSCVWLCMENFFKWKIISFDCKMNPLDPENNCRSYFTFKAFPEFFTPHGPTRQALQLHPTHQQEGDKAPPHTPMPVQGPPTLRWAALPFSPLHQWVFSLFFSSLTQPHFRPLQALHVLDPLRQNSPSRQRSPSHFQHLRSIAPTPSTKHFSQTHLLQYLIHPRLISLPPLKIVFNWRSSSSLKTDLVDLISISFPIYLYFPQSLTLSSSLSQFDWV